MREHGGCRGKREAAVEGERTIQIAPGRDFGFAICFTRDSLAEAERHAIACELREVARTIGTLRDDPVGTASSDRGSAVPSQQVPSRAIHP
jgi:hypothetical protein